MKDAQPGSIKHEVIQAVVSHGIDFRSGGLKIPLTVVVYKEGECSGYQTVSFHPIKQISIVHQYTKHKNEAFSLTHSLQLNT